MEISEENSLKTKLAGIISGSVLSEDKKALWSDFMNKADGTAFLPIIEALEENIEYLEILTGIISRQNIINE